MIRERLHMLIRAKRTIRSCKTVAQLECAIKYKEIVMNYLFDGDEHAAERWERILMNCLNDKALEITGLID